MLGSSAPFLCVLEKHCAERSSLNQRYGGARGQNINSTPLSCPLLVLQSGALTSLSHNTLSQPCLRTVPCYGPKGMPSMGLRTRGAFSQKAFPSAAAQGLLDSVSGQFVPVLPTLFVFLSPTQWLSPRILNQWLHSTIDTCLTHWA